MKIKWTVLYTTEEVTSVGVYKMKEKQGYFLKTQLQPKQVKWYSQRMQEWDADEEPNAFQYSEADVQGVKKATVKIRTESHEKKLKDLLKPTLKYSE